MSSDRIPSLDGLRAISIALVVFGHLMGTGGFADLSAVNVGGGLGALSFLGVRFFFTISGFLITNLLIKELAATGNIDLGRFYLRRTFRIFPAYYAFVLVVIALNHAGRVELRPGDILHALTYTTNYHFDHAWSIAHTWSLSVEEQFYLLWPAVVILLGRDRALWAAALFVVAGPFIRLGEWTFVPPMRDGLGKTFETVGDAIAIGCVLSGLRGWLHRQPRYVQLLSSRWLLLAPVLAMLGGMLSERPRIYGVIVFTVQNLIVAVCIDWCVTHWQGRVGRVLNSRPLVFVGTMSYSLYLWQQLFLNRYVATPLTTFPVNLLAVVVTALVSYYLIERPSLGLRQKVETAIFRARPARPRAVLVPRSNSAE
jgi:peptidoglycan/LPS O-acetylase OafA/YrhL